MNLFGQIQCLSLGARLDEEKIKNWESSLSEETRRMLEVEKFLVKIHHFLF